MFGAWHFIHGHSGVVEDLGNVVSTERKGWGLSVIAKPGSTNWVHFAVPSNAQYGWRIDHLHFKLTAGENAHVSEVHLWDGNVQISQQPLAYAGAEIDAMLVLEKEFEISRALGVSLKLETAPAGNGVFIFHAIGANFRQLN